MALRPALVIRVGIAGIWLLSPPVLTLLAVRQWRGEKRPLGLKAVWPVLVAAAVLTNWLLFALCLFAGQIGGFGSHYMTTRLADVFLLVSFALLIASIHARFCWHCGLGVRWLHSWRKSPFHSLRRHRAGTEVTQSSKCKSSATGCSSQGLLQVDPRSAQAD
jgi:hypothetical protein